MPTQLHLEFFQDGYRRIPGGLYIISTPESKKYLPEQGKKSSWKIGSSWDLGKRSEEHTSELQSLVCISYAEIGEGCLISGGHSLMYRSHTEPGAYAPSYDFNWQYPKSFAPCDSDSESDYNY